MLYKHTVFKFGGVGTADLNNKLGTHVCDNIRAIRLPHNVSLCKPEYGADLPSLDHVHVEVVKERRASRFGDLRNIYGNFEGAVRKIYDRPWLIALITTVPYTPPPPGFLSWAL